MVTTRSLPDCRPLLADPDDLTLVVQPVVDLDRGAVAGYEAQARFPGTAGPDVWFAAASDAGLAAEVQALLLHRTLARLPFVPAGCFLLVAVRADLLSARPVREALASRPRLDRLVLEVGSAPAVEVEVLRARGARFAQPAGLPLGSADPAPDLVVLDRDDVRAPGGTGFAAPGAPVLLADAVDTTDDLSAALLSGAALARGWLFGTPSVTLAPLLSSVTELVRTRRARIRLAEAVLPLVRPFPPSGVTPALEVDGDGAVLTLLLPGPARSTWRRPVTLSVPPTAPAGETLRRALSRAPEHRRDPVLCTDESGRPLGLLHVADLVRAVR